MSILLTYLLTTNEFEENKVMDIIKNELGDEAEDIMPTLVQKWIEQGRKEGIEKGFNLKAVETCKNALRSGISPETISTITGLSLEKVLEIKKELK